MTDRRRVNFRDSPPSSGTSSRYASESGVVSPSEHPTDAVMDWSSLEDLQEAYHKLSASKDHWKTKAKDSEAKWRSDAERVEQLSEENQRLFKEKKALRQEVGDLKDEIDNLRQELAEANARINELACNVTTHFVGGASPAAPSSINGSALSGLDVSSTIAAASGGGPSASRDGKRSSSTKGSPGSNSSSGSSGSHGSHSSVHAKAGGSSSNSSSTSTAKISRSNSRRDAAPSPKDMEKEQKQRLSQRFDPKSGEGTKSGDSNASSSSAASSSHKHAAAAAASSSHHASNHAGSSGHHGHHGSSGGSNGSNEGGSGSGGGGGGASSSSRPPRSSRSTGYYEPFGPGASTPRATATKHTPASPNKGIPRSAAPAAMPPPPPPPTTATSPHYGYTAVPASHYPLPAASQYMSPRGDKQLTIADGPRATMTPQYIFEENTADAYPDSAAYYANSYASVSARRPRR